MVAASKAHIPKADRERVNGQYKTVPILTRIKARNLYLLQGLSHREIAAECGITVQASHKMASRDGWTAQRKEQKRALMAKADVRIAETSSEALDAIASVSEQHAVRGLERVGAALEANGEFAARDFQSWTGGVKNLVSIMREIRAPAENAPTNAGLNVFVIRVGDDAAPAKPEVNITPNDTAIELAKP